MIEPAVYTFVSILEGSRCLKQTNNVAACVANIIKNSVTDEVVYKTLGLSSRCTTALFNKRQTVALEYAKILEQYPPDENGCIGQPYSYYQLVVVVKAVYESHMSKWLAKTCGMEIYVDHWGPFYAKVTKGKPYIFFGCGNTIGKGTFGVVNEIFEIASRQILAQKQALLTQSGRKQIAKEINNLQRLHFIAGKKGLSTEGLQPEPLAIFNAGFQGYIGPKYDMNLYDWLQKKPSYVERLAIVKSLMLAYEKLYRIGFWHGDLSLANILIHNDRVVIIDWAGSILYEEAIRDLRCPSTRSRYYNNNEDYERMKSYSTEFPSLIETMDLHAISIILFDILAMTEPFREIEQNGQFYSDTRYGITKDSMLKLLEENSMELVHILRKMLAHDYKKRYTPEEAIEVWKKV